MERKSEFCVSKMSVKGENIFRKLANETFLIMICNHNMIQHWSTLLEDSLSKNTLNISIKIQFRYSAVSVWEDYNKNTLES